MENSQTIRKQMQSPLDRAMAYYTLISAINNIGLTTKQLQLLSYMAVTKEQFTKRGYAEQYNTTILRADSTMQTLLKTRVMKEGKIHPSLLRMQFDIPFTITISVE